MQNPVVKKQYLGGFISTYRNFIHLAFGYTKRILVLFNICQHLHIILYGKLAVFIELLQHLLLFLEKP